MTDRQIAAALVAAVFIAYSANGREIGSYDTQPTKYAARELLLRGSLSLGHVVGRTPELGRRSAFGLARDGRYRSVYSPVPAILAATITWPFWKSGVVDIRAPRAASLMAAGSSALLVSLAVGVAYLIARRDVSRDHALFIAAAFGLGTGLWSTASQTLWQHETAILGLTLAVFGLTGRSRPTRLAVAVGIGLGLAGSSRLQLMPAILILLAATTWILGWRQAAIAAALSAAFIVPLLIANIRWFGSVLGAAPMLEALHQAVHGRGQAFRLEWDAVAGLLWSPSRGLFVFSPVVALAAVGLPRLLKSGWRSPLAACMAAAVAQFLLYASYSVWWGGHTYGPRYLLDVLPLLLPLAAAAASSFEGPVAGSVACVALGCSVFIAGLGAFGYPNDAWNSSPTDVDRDHARLWDWSDNQIKRTWNAGPSPQNFSLLTRDAFRPPPH